MKIKAKIITLIVLALVGLNAYLFTKQNNFSFSEFAIPFSDFSFPLSGLAISNTLSEQFPTATSNMNLSMIIFISQWVILIGIAIILYLRHIKHKKIETEAIKVSQVRHSNSRSQTDFDTLYELLEEKTKLSIGAIAKFFHIKKEVALDWAKILEENDLASIEYPAFTDPEITIRKKEGKEKDTAGFFSVKQEGKEEKKEEKEEGKEGKNKTSTKKTQTQKLEKKISKNTKKKKAKKKSIKKNKVQKKAKKKSIKKNKVQKKAKNKNIKKIKNKK